MITNQYWFIIVLSDEAMRSDNTPGGRKERDMEEMEKVTVNRLIEWLKEHGHTSDEIVECIEYITGDKKKGAE